MVILQQRINFRRINFYGDDYGELWEGSFKQSRKSDAREKARDFEDGALWQDGEEPEAGHCDRPVGGAQSRRQSAVEEDRHGEQDQLRKEKEPSKKDEPSENDSE